MFKTFRALLVRNYRVYAIGTAVSNIGTWMQRIAQDWLVLQLTNNSGTAIGITTALQFLPVLLFSPYAGILADKFSKRRMMQVTALMMAVPALLLGILAVLGVAEVWHVYVLAFAFGTGAAFDTPARQSFVPEIVGKADVANAIGLNSVSFNLARMVGPALAGLLIAGLGSGIAAAGWVIALNGVSYAATIWALHAIDGSALTPNKRRRSGSHTFADALRYVGRSPQLVVVFVISFFTGAFGINFQLTNALMATQVFEQGAGGFGLLGSVMAIGSFAGALVGARRSGVSTRTIGLSALAFGCALLVAGVMPTYWAFAGWTAVVGLCVMLMTTASHTSVQLFTDPDYRGRVTALYVMVSMGGVPIGGPIIGWVGEAFGARWTLGLGGIVVLIATASALAYYKRATSRQHTERSSVPL